MGMVVFTLVLQFPQVYNWNCIKYYLSLSQMVIGSLLCPPVARGANLPLCEYIAVCITRNISCKLWESCLAWFNLRLMTYPIISFAGQ